MNQANHVDPAAAKGAFSTTRMIGTEKPADFERDTDGNALLAMPWRTGRKGEGGIRLTGCYKRSVPGISLVSVVTVVLNGATYLEKTIQSIIGQTYGNIEYIVVDGGSTDGTADIIRQYEGAIDYWVSEPDAGIYDAMNKAIDLASGRWVIFMNGGDRFFGEGAVEIAMAHIPQENAAAGYYSDCEIVYASGLKRIQFAAKWSDLWQGMPCSHQALIAGGSALKKNKFSLSYPLCADYEQLLRLSSQGLVFDKLPNILPSVASGGLSDSTRSSVYAQFHAISRAFKTRPRIVLAAYFTYRQLHCRLSALVKMLLPPALVARLYGYLRRGSI